MAPLSSLPIPSLLRSSPSSTSQPKRPLILLIALISVCFHLYLASRLSLLSHSLADTIANEDGGLGAGREGDWRRLEAMRMGVGVARLSSWSSAAVAGLGAWGVLREHLPFLRLFTLHSFISLLLELCLLVLIILLTLSTSSTSHSSLSSSLCQSLTSTDLSLDLFGYSLESCEERFGSLVLTALGFVATIALVRAWGSLKTLEYYEAMSKRHRRGGKPAGLSIDTSRSSSHRYRDSDPEPSPSKRHHSSNPPHTPSSSSDRGQRILLLPDPLSRAREAAARLESSGSGSAAGKGEEVPMLSLTASSPMRESFPPVPRGGGGAAEGGGEQGGGGGEQKYLVYAPVMMSAEEARLVGARELILGSPSRHHSHTHRPRSRSNATVTPSSRHLSSPSTESDRPLPARSASEDSLITPIAEAGTEFPPSPSTMSTTMPPPLSGVAGGKGKGKLA